MPWNPSQLPEIFAAPKLLGKKPSWDGTFDPIRFHFCVPLSIDGAYPEGFQLRAKAHKSHFNRDVTFQLEVEPPGHKKEPIARVDWRPFQAHSNRNIGPKEFRLLVIAGTHHHAFEINYFEKENRMLKRNLPVARSIEPDFKDFQQLVAFVGSEFRILDMERIQPPEWTADLFDV